MVRQYVGARYVPKFMGLYNATTIYEGLCVVDNGLGTSYIAKKIVPAGTPLTNTEYWAVYGASSGAIIDLQNRMTALEEDMDEFEEGMYDLTSVFPSGTKIVGHAGASELAPANTMAGFEMACLLDADAIETDLMITSDDVLVCSHNNATSHGNIRDNDYATVHTWSASGNYSSKFDSAKTVIPPFTDFLAICKNNNKTPVVELKWEETGHITVEELVHVHNAIKAYGLEREAVIISWVTEPLVAYKSAYPEATTIRLLDTNQGEASTAMIDSLHELGINGVGVEGYNTSVALVKYAHSLGMITNLFTINSYNGAFHSLLEASVDFITTGTIINCGDFNDPYGNTNNYKLFTRDGYPCVSKFFTHCSDKFPRYGDSVSKLISVPDLVHRFTLYTNSNQRAYLAHGYKKVGDALNYNIPTGYDISIITYAANGDFIAETGWINGTGKYIIKQAGYVFTLFTKNPAANIDYWELVSLLGTVTECTADGYFGSVHAIGVANGYISTSGNYFTFAIPIAVDSSITAATITAYNANASSIFIDGTKYDLSSSVDSMNIEQIRKGCIEISAKFSTTKTPFLDGVINYDITLNLT